MSLVEKDVEHWVIKMSAVGEIKASRHAPQRNDTAIKLCIKVAFDILCNYIYIHLGKGLKESCKCIQKNNRAFDQDMHQRYDNQKRKNLVLRIWLLPPATLRLAIQHRKPLTATKAIRKPWNIKNSIFIFIWNSSEPSLALSQWLSQWGLNYTPQQYKAPFCKMVGFWRACPSLFWQSEATVGDWRRKKNLITIRVF